MNPDRPQIRLGSATDLPAVAAIQAASPEAAQWHVADYLDHDFLVATVGNAVAGFAVLRRIAEDECEVLNIAVALDFRRKGVARALLSAALESFRGAVFLEVRESNTAAIEFYKSLNFNTVSLRQNYYHSPPEAAIVMKFHSC
jgi:ribosomal-protein-alanine N-acetyltransferase